MEWESERKVRMIRAQYRSGLVMPVPATLPIMSSAPTLHVPEKVYQKLQEKPTFSPPYDTTKIPTLDNIVLVDVSHARQDNTIVIDNNYYELELLAEGASKRVFSIKGTDLVYKTTDTGRKGFFAFKEQPFETTAYEKALEKDLVVRERDVSPGQDRSHIIAPNVDTISIDYFKENEEKIIGLYKQFQNARLYLGDGRADNIGLVDGRLKLLDSDMIFSYDEFGGSDYDHQEIYKLYLRRDGRYDRRRSLEELENDWRDFAGMQKGVRLPKYLFEGNLEKILLRFGKEPDRLMQYYSDQDLEWEIASMHRRIRDRNESQLTLTSVFLVALAAGIIIAQIRAKHKSKPPLPLPLSPPPSPLPLTAPKQQAI